jgi:hypothetical protein
MSKWGYKEITLPNGKGTRPNGTVLEHRYVAELLLGRSLSKSETVHHIDGNRSNNSDDNILVFASRSDHARYHKGGVLKDNGNGAWISTYDRLSLLSRVKYKIQEHPCEACGKITLNSRFCSYKCSSMSQRRVERPSASKLSELLENNSWCAIGRMYGVSDTAVRKWARAYSLL